MLVLQLLAGALVGAGILVVVRALVRPVQGVGATLARLDSGRRAQSAVTKSGAVDPRGRLDSVREGIGARLEAEATARGWEFSSARTDLAVMNRSMATHLGTKVLLAVAAVVWAPTMARYAGAGGLGVPLVACLVVGAAAYKLPDVSLHREAEHRRRDFRHVMGSFLDLVAMNLAGGRGLPEALMAASTIGEHWAMVRIRQALSNARIVGLTPWEGIARLGHDLGVEELRDLASALGLAGDEGAKIRTSLMSRAESMRRKELADVEGAAGERSQSMLIAQLVVCFAFLIFLAYPAVTQLTA